MFIPGPDLITGIMAADSQHIIVIGHGLRKSLTSRLPIPSRSRDGEGGLVILSNIFLFIPLSAFSSSLAFNRLSQEDLQKALASFGNSLPSVLQWNCYAGQRLDAAKELFFYCQRRKLYHKPLGIPFWTAMEDHTFQKCIWTHNNPMKPISWGL